MVYFFFKLTRPSSLLAPEDEEGSRLLVAAEDAVDAPEAPSAAVPKGLSFLNGIALVMSLQIGSGIFLTPSQVAKNVPNPGCGILVWFFGGVLVWTGVCSFIELGTSIATNGGLQEYLRYCYGDFVGAFFSWTWVTISRSASMAVVTAVFAEYLCKSVLPGPTVSAVAVKSVALIGLWLMTVLNWTGPKAGADFANKFLVVKLGALVLIATSGMISSSMGVGDGTATSPYGWFGTDPSLPQTSLTEQISQFVTAIFAALFAYNGFESIGFVLGDVREPARSLPRILHTAMTVVITGFILTNMSLYMTLSMDQLRSTDTPTISFATKVLGPVGRVVLSIVVAISALGALNANIFATASLSVAASQRGYFPKLLGNLHCSSQADEELLLDAHGRRLGRYLGFLITQFSRLTAPSRWEKKVPVYAMTVNAMLVSMYLVLGTYDGLVTFIGISQYFFYMLAAGGVFIIRRKDSNAGEPGRFRTGSWNPIIFILCSSFIILRGVASNVSHGIALCALALVVFVVFKSRFSLGGHVQPVSLRGAGS
ncbi:large neutral amino acids transporter small subunit 1 [Lasiosphaeris hirsuta]|uniref:Large neutral amino acids transporter small subunit 1 n=1 Tax=Lasiosphaeris hirsuta TaxID=260670 RepID=A0AA40DPI9_9PEZI|nr:large neutral amino acids transporter small subunit 1 [Lasiosphaeris hirsuta]